MLLKYQVSCARKQHEVWLQWQESEEKAINFAVHNYWFMHRLSVPHVSCGLTFSNRFKGEQLCNAYLFNQTAFVACSNPAAHNQLKTLAGRKNYWEGPKFFNLCPTLFSMRGQTPCDVLSYGHIVQVSPFTFYLVFPTRVFPNPKPVFFQLPNQGILKNWNLYCIQILVILITLKLQIGACNGQISTFKLSIIIMRHEVRVLLGDHRTFVVGPFMFSYNWPI